jgi:predicted nucleotidyltransferase
MPELSRDYSLRKLRELSEKIDVEPLLEGHPLCVYVTGSYGRLEAWTGSDIDLFFLYDSADETQRYPWTRFVRLSARLIEKTDEMGFPPFSGDGRYLELQYVSDMENVLGSPRDDSLNAFTARMLLLLESQPLHDRDVYEALLKRIIGFYYRDFEDHGKDFLPTFLLNDILRFWRTLTLNYEHHRLKLRCLSGEELESKKADSALKNYKLKFSRLATCFSMVTKLSAMESPVTPDHIFELCRITPSERFQGVRDHSAKAKGLVDSLHQLYAEFLERVQRPEADLQAEFRVSENRKDALRHASRYGDLIYELVDEVSDPDRMRYLVI